LQAIIANNGQEFASALTLRLFSNDVLEAVYLQRRQAAQQAKELWEKKTTEEIIAGLPTPAPPVASTPPPPTAPTARPPVAVQVARLPNGITMDFVRVEAGSFLMGCSEDDNCDGDKPAHRVQISKPFEIGIYEVTQAQWQAVMRTAPSRSTGDRLPVEQVSWNDVQQFLNAMNTRRDGYLYRLPTEAEWEYAARAGGTGPFPQRLGDVAWFSDLSRNIDTQMYPVGSKAPNAWGLYDMFGNTAEWVQDRHGAFTDLDATDPTGPTDGTARVVRGGSTFDGWPRLRASSRYPANPTLRALTIGFRCVRVPVATSR
jgi:formylglycine-generating enzyme required for sulfatase activity